MSEHLSPRAEQRPDLRTARRAARRLLADARAGDLTAVARLHRPHSPVLLSDAQHALAREAGYDSWAALVRDAESFAPAELATIPWERVRAVTVVCLPQPGRVMLYRDGERWVAPRGSLLRGEDPWDDAVLRIPLQTMGFRRQGTHAYAIDDARRHVAFWVDGSLYTGAKPHRRDAETRTLTIAEAARLLTRQGDGALARLVEAAGEDQDAMTYDRHKRDLRRTLTGAYLRSSTHAGGSGFGGDEDDWRDARSGLAAALDGLADDLGRPGLPVTLLDLGSANGHLAASMVTWGAERGVLVDPYGVDISPELVERARELNSQWSQRFWVGDALDWRHPAGQRFDLVHLLLDVLPAELHAAAITNALASTTPGGRLLVSCYDPRPECSAQIHVTRAGHAVAGRTPVRARRATGRPYGSPSVWITAP